VKIKRSCMSDHVRDLVVARILDGSYPPGTRLKELVLAGEFSVSQAPVREALRKLEALGLVESEPYRGTRVRAADSSELREAYELRALIEERSAQLAVPCAPAMLKALRAELARLRRAVRARDHDAHADAAIALHRRIVEASGNRTFLNAWDSLHWEVRTRIAVRRVRAAGFDPTAFVDAHEKIIDALEAADGRRAGRLLRQLIAQLLAVIDPPAKTHAPRSAKIQPAPV
jgi:DNA-binding GntR family transcriptional regulator